MGGGAAGLEKLIVVNHQSLSRGVALWRVNMDANESTPESVSYERLIKTIDASLLTSEADTNETSPAMWSAQFSGQDKAFLRALHETVVGSKSETLRVAVLLGRLHLAAEYELLEEGGDSNLADLFLQVEQMREQLTQVQNDIERLAAEGGRGYGPSSDSPGGGETVGEPDSEFASEDSEGEAIEIKTEEADLEDLL